jgi:hypothetical protein
MQNLDGNNDYSDDVDWPFNTQWSRRDRAFLETYFDSII